MKEIRMVDLNRQYLNIKDEIDSAIIKVINSSEFINGSEVFNFKKNLEKYLGVKHVIPCANGTDALQIALISLGLQPGDEVITSDFSFIAAIEVIALMGLKPVITDVDPFTFQISAEGIKKAITKKTKAIIPVHLFGQCSDMESILKISKENNLHIIEDSAQAIGTRYTFSDGHTFTAGTMGDFGTTSFFPAKNLGCYGDGGAIFTNNDNLAQKARSIANHGMEVRYYYDNIGINSRLDTIQAAILNVKLQYLEKYHQSRQAVAGYYDLAFQNCKNIKIPARTSNSTHIFHQYTLVTGTNINRDDLKKYLHENGIPSMIYYPVPLHLQKAYLYLGYKEGDFPVTESLCKSVISLPMHTELSEEELKYISTTVLQFMS